MPAFKTGTKRERVINLTIVYYVVDYDKYYLYHLMMINRKGEKMFKVTYAIDTLDQKPDVSFFDTESEAIDYVEEEIERRVSFQVSHSQYRITENDLNSLREIERTLVHIEDWRE